MANVLGVEVAELQRASGYGAPIALSAPVDRPFPLQGLTPESFERFCFFFLQKLYRGREARIHRAGESGHKQGGIDISAQGQGWVHTFQCKRVNEFGPKRVVVAVSAQTVPADKKVLLLSSVASPAARDEIARHASWELWDREDISNQVRTLSRQDQRELVHVFFRSQRLELLGETDASPWMSATAFFEPFDESSKAFNHAWRLVGRAEDAAILLEALEQERSRVTMLVGAAGGGKSRLLRHVLGEYGRRHPSQAVWLLSPTDAVTPRSLEELGTDPKLLVVDDAHDRQDLAALMRHCVMTGNRSRLLLVLRPYGRELIRHQAAALALSGDAVKSVEISSLDFDDTVKLAAEVLEGCGGPVGAAEHVARATLGSSLATVLGAHVVAKEGLHPAWLDNDAEYQAQILRCFHDVITGGIVTGQDVERLRGVLRVVALVQPILPDEPALLRLIEAMEDVQAHDATRLLKILIEAGVLFRRGPRYRLAPDLLADSIIERYCVAESKAVDYVERVFEHVDEHEAYLTNLLLNLGRLDWRKRQGDTRDSRLLSGIWSRLRWIDEYSNPHVEAAAAVAYYQPRQALDFARTLVRDGHGDDESVCSMIKYAGHTLEFVDTACELLWQAGVVSQEAVGRGRMGRAVPVLKELASFEPNKPVEFIDRVVSFAIEALESPEAIAGNYGPFEVLEGALATEAHTTRQTNSITVTFSSFAVPQDALQDVRGKIVAAIFRCLTVPPAKRAFQAARALDEALRGPSGLMGRHPGVEEKRGWDLEHRSTLSDLLHLLEEHSLPAVVLVRIAESVHWHAYYGPPESQDLARRVIAHLGRDLETRLTRALMDGWGSNTWPFDEGTVERSAYEADMAALVSDLMTAYPEPNSLGRFLESVLQKIDDVGGGGGGQHVLLNRLIRENLGFAQEVVRLQAAGARGTLASYGGTGLGVLLESQSEESLRRVQEVMASGSNAATAMLAEGFARFEPKQPYAASEQALIRTLFRSKDDKVLRFAPSLARNVAKIDPALAIDLVCTVDFRAAGQWTREFFMWLGVRDGIPAEALSDRHLELLLKSLEDLPKLEDHWIWSFLKLSAKRVPGAVAGLVKSRLERAVMRDDLPARPLLPPSGNEEGLGLLKAEDGWAHVVELLEWARGTEFHGMTSYHFGRTMVALCGAFDGPALADLAAWMKGGGSLKHVKVAAAIVRHMNHDLVYEQPAFVREVLKETQLMGLSARKVIASALYEVTTSAMRSGTPGEPFPEDIRQLRHAEHMLGRLGRFDPAYDLWTALRDAAREGISRQQRQKEAMDAEDGERR